MRPEHTPHGWWHISPLASRIRRVEVTMYHVPKFGLCPSEYQCRT